MVQYAVHYEQIEAKLRIDLSLKKVEETFGGIRRCLFKKRR